MSVLTQDEYVRHHGLKCACCHAETLMPDTEKLAFDLGDVVIQVDCESCGANYIERYVIAGWEPLCPEDSENE